MTLDEFTVLVDAAWACRKAFDSLPSVAVDTLELTMRTLTGALEHLGADTEDAWVVAYAAASCALLADADA